MGVISLIFAIQEIKLLQNKISKISDKMYLLKLMATSAVGLTFVTVVGYLGPISPGGIQSMLLNSNLFFHLIIPVLSILTFSIFEQTNVIKFKHVITGVIPTVVYEIYYLINVLTHIENGKVPFKYDWYWFVQGGLWQIFIVMPLMIGVTYVISLLLWKFNKIKAIK